MTIGRARRARRAGERVTGEQRYVADIHLPDELHVKLVTLPVAHARIVSIDAAAALALPGVRMVFTAADLPATTPRFGPQFTDRPVIATGETKYHGDPVAAVAAETRDVAEEAARLVQVDYEELPAVFTIAGALADGAPLVQDPSACARTTHSPTRTCCASTTSRWGDVATARRRIWWSRTPTASRWSPISPSSRTRSLPRRMATASPCGHRSSIRTGCSA